MVLKAAMGSAVITPPVGLFQGGYGARKQHSIGIHDDLRARCVAFSDGSVNAMAIIADLVFIPKAVVKATRELIAKALPVNPDNVIMAATHTHSGPGPGRALKGFAKGLDLYMSILPYHIAGLAYETFGNVKECSIAAGRGESFTGHHRRTWDESTNYVDRELVVARLQGGCSGALFNIGTHAVKMSPENLWYSADFPGFAIGALEGLLGSGSRAMFFQAPCGNVNPWNQPFENPETTFDDCKQVGMMLAGDVASVIGKLDDHVNDLDVRAGAKQVKIPVEPGKGVNEMDPDDVVITKVQAITLGNLLSIVGVPGEMFSKFGRIIRDSVKTRYCIVQEITENELVDQDMVSYVPTREAFGARDEQHPTGGYEVMAAIPNPETGYIIADAAIGLVNDLISG